MEPTPPSVPYEILPPPIFAFEPALFHWMLLFCFLLGLVALWRLQSLKRRATDSAAISEFSVELRRLAEQRKNSGCDAHLLEHVSLRLRRLLSAILGRPIDALGVAELENIAEQFTHEPSGNLLKQICCMERLRYAPDQSLPADYLLSLANSLDAISERRAT